MCVYVSVYVFMYVSVYVSVYVCVSFNKVEVALQIYCHSVFHTPFSNLYSIHNCLLGNYSGTSPL